MAAGPEVHDLLEPESPRGVPALVEAVEGRQEGLEVAHDLPHVGGTQEGPPLVQHLGGGALCEVAGLVTIKFQSELQSFKEN